MGLPYALIIQYGYAESVWKGGKEYYEYLWIIKIHLKHLKWLKRRWERICILQSHSRSFESLEEICTYFIEIECNIELYARLYLVKE